MLLHLWTPPCPLMLDCLESDHHLSPGLLQYPLSGFSASTLSFFQSLFCLHPSARVICLKHRSDQVLLLLQSLMTIYRRHFIFEWIRNSNLISGTFLISSLTSFYTSYTTSRHNMGLFFSVPLLCSHSPCACPFITFTAFIIIKSTH